MKRVLKCVQVFYCDQVLKRVQEYNVSKSSKLGLFPFLKFMSCTKGLQLQYLTVNQAYHLFVDISAMSLLYYNLISLLFIDRTKIHKNKPLKSDLLQPSGHIVSQQRISIQLQDEECLCNVQTSINNKFLKVLQHRT